MTESANTQLVRRMYEHFKTGDIESFLRSLADNVDWTLPAMENVPFSGDWRGREEVRRFFGILADVQDALEFEPEEFIAQGTRVVGLGHFAFRIRATGRIARARWAHVWTVNGNEIVSCREYTDTAAVIGAHPTTP